jgi:Ala-tRNA(Pro) deacylase
MSPGSRATTIEAPKEEQPVAQRGGWMSLEEIERMERRLRRLLEAPIAAAPQRPANPTGAPPPNAASTGGCASRRGGLMITGHQPADALMKALRREHVSYELFPHRHTETALAEAEALHEDPHQVAKTLILRTPYGYVRAVLRAVDRLDLEKARIVLRTEKVELASEEDLVGAYPEFELGAVPPVGGAYDRVLVDQRLFDRRFVLFEAGTHDESIRLHTGDLLSLAEAEVADLAEEHHEQEGMS